MNPQTLFQGNYVVFDAMVIINFHGLLALDDLVSWAPGEIVVVKQVRDEAKRSKAGKIDLTRYVEAGQMVEGFLQDAEEEVYYEYMSEGIGESEMHSGEAACLALSTSRQYGLACGEHMVREEFKRICPDQICVSSWMIVGIAETAGFIGPEVAENLKKGFSYV